MRSILEIGDDIVLKPLNRRENLTLWSNTSILLDLGTLWDYMDYQKEQKSTCTRIVWILLQKNHMEIPFKAWTLYIEW